MPALRRKLRRTQDHQLVAPACERGRDLPPLDGTTNQWRDGEALFLCCTRWRRAAENFAESLRRGDRVIVTGRLQQESFEAHEGDKRTTIELDVEEIGASLKFTALTLTKTERVTAQAPASEQATDDEPPFYRRYGRLQAPAAIWPTRQQSSGVLDAVDVDTGVTTQQCSAKCTPSTINATSSRPDRSASRPKRSRSP